MANTLNLFNAAKRSYNRAMDEVIKTCVATRIENGKRVPLIYNIDKMPIFEPYVQKALSEIKLVKTCLEKGSPKLAEYEEKEKNMASYLASVNEFCTR